MLVRLNPEADHSYWPDQNELCQRRTPGTTWPCCLKGCRLHQSCAINQGKQRAKADHCAHIGDTASSHSVGCLVGTREFSRRRSSYSAKTCSRSSRRKPKVLADSAA